MDRSQCNPSPGLLGAGFTSNSTFPLIGISAGQASGGRGPARFFPANIRFFQAMLPDLAICTSPTSFAQSRGSARSRIRCSTPGFAAGAAAGSVFFFFFTPNNQFSPQTEQFAVSSFVYSCQNLLLRQ